MTTEAVSTVAATPPMGLLARIVGMFFSPRATYAEVVMRPRWFGVLTFSVAVIAGGVFLLLSTDAGQKAVLEQQTQVIESFGIQLTDRIHAQIEQGARRAKYTAPIAQMVVIPLVAVIIAAILFGVFTIVYGGDATFRQVFAIVAHAMLIGALQNTFARPLNYALATMSSPTSLLALFPFIEEKSFLGRLTGTLDLFQMWSILSLAIGIGVLYQRRTAPIATTLLGMFVVVVTIIAAVRTW